MNKVVMDHLMRKMGRENHRSSYEDERDYRKGYDRRDSGDYRNSRDYEDSRDYRDRRDYERDGMRSSGDSREWHITEDSRDYGNVRDYHNEPSVFLTKHDMRKWDKMIENFDGSKGCHYAISEIIPCAEKLGIRFKEFTEKEFCMTVNMMYADYGKTVKKYAKSSDEELHMCVELARDFLEDPDGPEPSEKLALYFHCIVNDEV